MSPKTTFKDQSTICISIDEFENLMACKKELLAIKEDLKTFLGDDIC